jgi:hypothetical protein
MADAEEKISIIRNGISISHCTHRITKIMSGMKTSADQTSVDVAIEKGTPQRGWIPKLRKTMPPWFPKNTRAKKWKAQLSGTNQGGGQFWVVVSKGGSPVADAREMAEKHQRLWINIDAGAGASKDSKIYPTKVSISETLLFRFR